MGIDELILAQSSSHSRRLFSMYGQITGGSWLDQKHKGGQ
jgi:hypothetical protein